MQIKGTHDSANISFFFERALYEWKLVKENVTAVVTDNAAYMPVL
jgi:hypothetical protein